MRFRMAWRAVIPTSSSEILNPGDHTMPRLFGPCGALAMRRSALALSLVLVLPAALARAEDQTPPGCTVAGTNIPQQQDQGEVQINCTGLSEAMGNQLTDIMTRIVRDRLD